MKTLASAFRILLPLLLLVTGVGRGMSQPYTVSHGYASDIKNCIVRTYSDLMTVSYVETSTQHFFVHSDNASFAVNAEISFSYQVEDMAVHGDFVYFCGRDKNTGSGLWGWFEINDLFYGTGNLYVHNAFTTVPVSVDSLHSLAVVEDGTLVRLAVVGQVDSVGNARACTMEITGTEGQVAGWSYTLGQSTDKEERMTAVCVTDNYVVAAGTSHASLCSEVYRVYHRSSMFAASGGIYDTVLYFPGGGSVAVNHYWPGFAMTHYKGDMIATATYIKTYLSYWQCGVMVSVYDIPSSIGTYGVMQVDSWGLLPYTPPWTYSIEGLRFSNATARFALLLSGTFPQGSGSYIVDLSVSTGAAVFLFSSGKAFTSIDNNISQTKYIARGYDMSNPSQSLLLNDTYGNPQGCALSISPQLDSYNTSSKFDPSPLRLYTGQFGCSTYVANLSSDPTNMVCP